MSIACLPLCCTEFHIKIITFSLPLSYGITQTTTKAIKMYITMETKKHNLNVMCTGCPCYVNKRMRENGKWIENLWFMDMTLKVQRIFFICKLPHDYNPVCVWEMVMETQIMRTLCVLFPNIISSKSDLPRPKTLLSSNIPSFSTVIFISI